MTTERFYRIRRKSDGAWMDNVTTFESRRPRWQSDDIEAAQKEISFAKLVGKSEREIVAFEVREVGVVE